MSIQDKLEHILKDIHVFFSKGDVYMNSPENVIINKREMFELLEKLNLCVYEMMDQYEVTIQSRELAQRRSEKKGEAIIQAAMKRSEDVYAASFVYTDEALGHINSIVSEASASVQRVFENMNATFEREQERIKTNQLELREQLQDFKDTDKYLHLIEDLNKEREKEKASHIEKKKIQNEQKEHPVSKPEIKINKAYFEQMGYDVDEPDKKTAELEKGIEASAAEVKEQLPETEIKVDLDAEYFKWKEEDSEESGRKGKEKKRFFFW